MKIDRRRALALLGLGAAFATTFTTKVLKSFKVTPDGAGLSALKEV